MVSRCVDGGSEHGTVEPPGGGFDPGEDFGFTGLGSEFVVVAAVGFVAVEKRRYGQGPGVPIPAAGDNGFVACRAVGVAGFGCAGGEPQGGTQGEEVATIHVGFLWF